MTAIEFLDGHGFRCKLVNQAYAELAAPRDATVADIVAALLANHSVRQDVLRTLLGLSGAFHSLERAEAAERRVKELEASIAAAERDNGVSCDALDREDKAKTELTERVATLRAELKHIAETADAALLLLEARQREDEMRLCTKKKRTAELKRIALEWRALDESEPIPSPLVNEKLRELAFAVDALRARHEKEPQDPPRPESDGR